MGGSKARALAFSTSGPESAGMENVLGFGVGFRFSSGSLCGEVAPKSRFAKNCRCGRSDRRLRSPQPLTVYSTDEESMVRPCFTAMQTVPAAVPCGVSISNIDLNGSGTLGCLVVTNTNKLCLLSNNHVLANENAANIGDPIIQPGNAEPVAAPVKIIGQLEQFVPIQATGNLVDAGRLALTSLDLASPSHITYSLNPQPTGVTLGMSVIKNGRTTQSTLGMVTDVGVNISVGYDPFPARAEMRNQIAIRGVNGPFSMPGDSGSLIVTAATKQPVALLFAGSSDNSMTFANPIDAVMSALGIARFLAGQV